MKQLSDGRTETARYRLFPRWVRDERGRWRKVQFSPTAMQEERLYAEYVNRLDREK